MCVVICLLIHCWSGFRYTIDRIFDFGPHRTGVGTGPSGKPEASRQRAHRLLGCIRSQEPPEPTKGLIDVANYRSNAVVICACLVPADSVLY